MTPSAPRTARDWSEIMNQKTIESLIGQGPGQLEITEYNATTAALEMLREKYAALPDVKTPEGLATAKAARVEIRGYRSDLEKTRLELKAPLAQRAQIIDAEAQRIKAELLLIEAPIDAAIKAEEQRQADEKAAQKRVEAERRAAIEARVGDIRAGVLAVAGQDAAAIRAALDRARAFEPDPDEFAEFWPQAAKAIAEARQALEALLAQREAFEDRQAEDAARLEAQREELDRQRDELNWQRTLESAHRQAEGAAPRGQGADGSAAETQADPAPAPPGAPEPTPAETRKPAPIKGRKAKADPLAALKDALAAGTVSGDEAIERAYRLGFEAGERAARQAA